MIISPPPPGRHSATARLRVLAQLRLSLGMRARAPGGSECVCVLLLLSTLRVCLATPVSGIIMLCYVARCRPCPVSALYIFQPMRVALLSAAVTVQVYRAVCTRVHWRARPLSCSHPPAETHRNVATSGTLGEFLVGPESEFLQEL